MRYALYGFAALGLVGAIVYALAFIAVWAVVSDEQTTSDAWEQSDRVRMGHP